MIARKTIFNHRQIAREAVATVLAKVLSTETMADVIDSLLCADDDERLNMCEAKIGQYMFEFLSERCPEAVGMAQTR